MPPKEPLEQVHDREAKIRACYEPKPAGRKKLSHGVSRIGVNLRPETAGKWPFRARSTNQDCNVLPAWFRNRGPRTRHRTTDAAGTKSHARASDRSRIE